VSVGRGGLGRGGRRGWGMPAWQDGGAAWGGSSTRPPAPPAPARGTRPPFCRPQERGRPSRAVPRRVADDAARRDAHRDPVGGPAPRARARGLSLGRAPAAVPAGAGRGMPAACATPPPPPPTPPPAPPPSHPPPPHPHRLPVYDHTKYGGRPSGCDAAAAAPVSSSRRPPQALAGSARPRPARGPRPHPQNPASFAGPWRPPSLPPPGPSDRAHDAPRDGGPLPRGPLAALCLLRHRRRRVRDGGRAGGPDQEPVHVGPGGGGGVGGSGVGAGPARVDVPPPLAPATAPQPPRPLPAPTPAPTPPPGTSPSAPTAAVCDTAAWRTASARQSGRRACSRSGRAGRRRASGSARTRAYRC
jgi:hypothetical protein